MNNSRESYFYEVTLVTEVTTSHSGGCSCYLSDTTIGNRGNKNQRVTARYL